MSDLKLRVTLEAIDKLTAPLRGIAKTRQRLTQSYRTDMRSYYSDIEKAEKALAGVRETQRKMIAAGNHNTSASIQAEEALMKRIEETNAAIERRNRLMDQEMAKIRKRQAAMDRGKKLMKGGGIALASASAATYAGVRFMAPGFDFDEQMSKVQALTRLNKNDPMLAKLRDQAKDLGATTWASATQAADAQAFYAMAGFDPQAIIDALPATLDLAKAGGVDVGRAADIGSNILSAFGLEPTEMDKVADIMVSVFTRTNTSLEMLGDTMKYVGPIAKDLKIPLEEATAMAGILGNVGIQGSQAGTAMRALQSRLAAPPSAAKKALKELKVSTKDVAGNFRSMPEILADVMKATSKLGNADRLGYLKAIAGEEAGSAFAAFLDKNNYQDLIKVIEAAYNAQSSFADELTESFNNLSESGEKALKDLGIDTLNENKELKEIPELLNEIVEASKALDKADQIDLMQKIGGNKLAEAFSAALEEADINSDNFIDVIEKFYKVEGESARVARTMGDNLKGDWVGLQSAIESVQIEIAEIEGGPLRKVVQTITKMVRAVSEWTRNNPKIAKTLAFVTSGIIALTGALGGLAIIIGIINVVFLANPVSWVILGIVAAIAALVAGIAAFVKYKEQVIDFFKAFYSSPAKYITKVIDWFSNLLDIVSNMIENIPVIGPLLKWAFEIAIAPLRGLLTLFKKLWEGLQWIWDNIDKIGATFVEAWESIKNALEPVADLFKTIIGFIDSMIEKIKNFQMPDWIQTAIDFMSGESEDGGIKNSTAYDQINMMYMPAQPKANAKTVTNNNEVSVHVTTQSNASPAIIAGAVGKAVSSSLIGDEY